MTTIKLTATDRALGRTEESVRAEREAMIRAMIAANPDTLTAGQKARRTLLAAEIGVTLVAPKAPALSPHEAAKQAWLTRRDNAESALRARAAALAAASPAFRTFMNHREQMKVLMRANPDFADFLTVNIDMSAYATEFNLVRANDTLAAVVAQIDAAVDVQRDPNMSDAPAVELHTAQSDEPAPRRNKRAA